MNRRIRNMRLVVCMISLLWLAGCDFMPDAELQKASQQYQQTQDIDSLQTLHKQLKSGMPRAEVEALLGAAQYSPTAGVDYYAAAKNNAQQTVNDGLVIEYTNEQGEATDQVQRFWLGTVAE